MKKSLQDTVKTAGKIEMSEYSSHFLKSGSKSPRATAPKIETDISKLPALLGKALIIESELYDSHPVTQTKKILNAFNINVAKDEPALTTSYVLGDYLTPDKFILGACNRRAELRSYDPELNIRRVFYPFNPAINSEVKHIVGQTDFFYGTYGSYVLNVPVNFFAKAWSGNNPQIYGPGPHVIHDANFRLESMRNAHTSDIHIKDGSNQDLVNQSDIYIHHGSTHMLNIPAGKMVKIRIGSVYHLLESREVPYVFDTGYFSIEKNQQGQVALFDATAPLITHGTIKRVMPQTGRVAVTYNSGIVEIIRPDSQRGPAWINSSNHEVREPFLNINEQQLVFPSEAVKAQRRLDNPKISEKALNHYVYRTKDSLEIGIKIMVAFEIEDPELTVSKLGLENIYSNIENVAVVDMGKIIIRLTSQEFVNPYSAKKSEDPEDQESKPTFHNEIHEMLKNELKQKGIKLHRFNIETPVYMDEKMAAKMAESASMTAETYAKQGIITGQALVQQAEANREAKTRDIELEQANRARIATANSILAAAQIEAKAILVRAQADADALKRRGAVFKEFPEVLDEIKTSKMAESLSHATLMYPLPLLQNSFANTDTSVFNSPNALFGGHAKKELPGNPPECLSINLEPH